MRDLGLLDESEMAALAAALAEHCTGGDVVLLRGPLGAGKTTFTRVFAEGLGIDPAHVRSPTYTVCMEHEGRVRLVHLDLYRMDAEGVSSPAFAALGLEHDELPPPDAVLVVEWSERWRDPPTDALVIELGRDSGDPSRRRVSVRATGPRHQARVDAWLSDLDPSGSGRSASAGSTTP